MSKTVFLRLLCLFLTLLLLMAVFGCGREEAVKEEEEIGGEVAADQDSYFWPWLSHAKLKLSSGEEILVPSFFDSESGYINKFRPGDSFKGKMVWPVEGDVFATDWVELSFTVDNKYVEYGDDNYTLEFLMRVENFKNGDTTGDSREYDVDIVETIEGFTVSISKIILAKNQVNYEGQAYDYIALVVSMQNDKEQ